MSTPIAAAVLALVNDALIAAGKSTLGFINVSFSLLVNLNSTNVF
jgi:hypothetical protein